MIEGAHRRVIDVAERDGTALQGFARRLGLTAEQAEDGAQEVYLRLYRALLDGHDIIDAKAWAFRAMYRLAMDEHRLRTRIQRLQDRLALGHSTEVDGGDEHALRLSIWSTVDRLPARQRQVLYLRYQADLPFDDIAEVLGITSGGARAIASTAMSGLRLHWPAGGRRP